jgi:hypothetical protein
MTDNKLSYKRRKFVNVTLSNPIKARAIPSAEIKKETDKLDTVNLLANLLRRAIISK